MREIPLHTRKPECQGLVALVDDEDFDRVNQHRWNVVLAPNGRFYARSNWPSAVRMHRFILGVSSDQQVDHEDHNGLNNQKHNLRAASNSQNGANRRPRLGGTSDFKGVSSHKVCRRWQAQGCLRGKPVYLGLFDTELEAAQAYNDFALKHHGEFAYLNEVTL